MINEIGYGSRKKSISHDYNEQINYDNICIFDNYIISVIRYNTNKEYHANQFL